MVYKPLQSAQAWITQFNLQRTPCMPYLVSIHQMASPPIEVVSIWLQLTTHLFTSRGWKAELTWLADLQRTVYPHKWLPISWRSSMRQGKFVGQDRRSCHCATPADVTAMKDHLCFQHFYQLFIMHPLMNCRVRCWCLSSRPSDLCTVTKWTNLLLCSNTIWNASIRFGGRCPLPPK